MIRVGDRVLVRFCWCVGEVISITRDAPRVFWIWYPNATWTYVTESELLLWGPDSEPPSCLV